MWFPFDCLVLHRGYNVWQYKCLFIKTVSVGDIALAVFYLYTTVMISNHIVILKHIFHTLKLYCFYHIVVCFYSFFFFFQRQRKRFREKEITLLVIVGDSSAAPLNLYATLEILIVKPSNTLSSLVIQARLCKDLIWKKNMIMPLPYSVHYIWGPLLFCSFFVFVLSWYKSLPIQAV